MLTTILYVLLVLVVVGILLWGLGKLTMIDPDLKNLIRVVIIVAAAIYVVVVLFHLVGGVGGLPR
jgi:hypothetical protein